MAQCKVEPDNNTYLFGGFRFSPAKQLLLRDGVPVRVGARALDILTLLLRQAGEAVGRVELEEFVWPNTLVHESSLRVNVAALRRALSDSAPGNTFIVSVPGRGYRFVGSVEMVNEEHPAALRQAPVFRKTLPDTSLVIGRAAEIVELIEALGNSRCITIVGPGGVGKTTIAVAVAHRVKDAYKGGICFVDLATVGDPQYVGAAIANAVGARHSSDDPLASVMNMLHGRHALLILDNCEHLTATIEAAVNRLVNGLPDITIMATSREPVGAETESLFRLSTLKAPLENPKITAKQALAFPAVKLFVTRAGERGEYTLTDADAPLVSAICQRLDGIALAIELAASKTAAYGIPKLLNMLEQRFPLLSNGPREAPLRQQTLQATLDWSYRLLSAEEASLLRYLSVFAGVFNVADAVAVSKGTGLETSDAINALERLATRSLVSIEYSAGAMRCRLLESTRAYAGERLAVAAERDRAMRVYARHIVSVFERAVGEWSSREKQNWLSEYAPKINDLRKVVSWAFSDNGDKMLGVTLTAAAIPLWEELSLVSEFRARVTEAQLALQGIDDCPINTRMRLAWSHASGLNFAHALVPEIEDAWLRCYELGREAGNTEYQLRGLWGLVIFLIYTGRSLEAIGRLEQFKAIAEERSDWSAIPEADRLIGMAETYIGRLDSAKDRLSNLSARFQSDKVPVRNTRYNMDQLVAVNCSLAIVLWLSGEPVRAMRIIEAAYARTEAIGHIISQSNLLALGALPVSFWSGDFRNADRYQALLEENGKQEDIEIWGRVNRFYRGALRAKRNEIGGLADMKARLEELMSYRFVMRAPMYYCMLAEAFLAAENLAEAKGAIQEARSHVGAPGEKWCLAEVLRVDALAHLRAGDISRAKALLVEAIREAQQIGALTLEIRASLVLAERLDFERRSNEALELLENVQARVSPHEVFADLAAELHRLRGQRGANVA